MKSEESETELASYLWCYNTSWDLSFLSLHIPTVGAIGHSFRSCPTVPSDSGISIRCVCLRDLHRWSTTWLFSSSQLELAVIVDATGFVDRVIDEVVSIGEGCWQGADRESSKVGSVLINTEVALVVPHERAKEKYTSSCVDHWWTRNITDQSWVFLVESIWVLFHDD